MVPKTGWNRGANLLDGSARSLGRCGRQNEKIPDAAVASGIRCEPPGSAGLRSARVTAGRSSACCFVTRRDPASRADRQQGTCCIEHRARRIPMGIDDGCESEQRERRLGSAQTAAAKCLHHGEVVGRVRVASERRVVPGHGNTAETVAYLLLPYTSHPDQPPDDRTSPPA